MTTIIVNERTKAGKTFLEFVKNLPFVEISEVSAPKKATPFKELTTKQRSLVNKLKKMKKKADAGLYKTQSLKSFYDEL